MKQFLYILLLISAMTSLYAEEWTFSRADLTFENDADVRTDRGYTQGARISTLLHRKGVDDSLFQIPFVSPYMREHFITFAIAQQMFTPEELNATEPIVGDRPYAGWLYFQTSLHQSSAKHLDTVSLKVGVVGQHAYMEQVQKFIHWLIGSPEPEGWNNQIGSKLGIQLDYQHKWRYIPEDFLNMESDIIPYISGELGNVAIKATAGASWRVGYNVPNDFGDSPMDEFGDNGVPISAVRDCHHKSNWSYYFNFGVGASYVLYDVFLDGTTLNGEQLVQKYHARAFGTYGGTLRYDNYALSYMRMHTTKEYQNQEHRTNYGSLLFIYNF